METDFAFDNVWFRCVCSGPENFRMKYFIHLKNHTEQILDTVGREVRNPKQAYAQAIRKLLDEREHAAQWNGWRLAVTDPAGAVVFSIDLAGRPH